MRIVIIGAGVIGVTSAWYLAKAGHQVTVLERQARDCGPQSASYANGGQLSVGHSNPWAAPGIPRFVMGSLLKENSPIHFQPDFTWHQTHWLLKMLRECNAGSFKTNQARMMDLSQHSRNCLHELQEQTHLEFDHLQGGILQIYQDDDQLEKARSLAENLNELGLQCQMLTPEQMYAVEPGLEFALKPIAGGIRYTQEESGDCELFTNRLTELARNEGVDFRFNVTVQQLVEKEDRIDSVLTDQGDFQADAYIVAAGASSYPLLDGLVDLPLYPIKGYSITSPVIQPEYAPRYSLLDATDNVSIARLNTRVRVAGFAEVVGFDTHLEESRIDQLKNNLAGWFPGGTALDEAISWTGFRPMTPDGTPIVSATRYSNLYVNTGHGTFGFTMSCGSAQILADIIDHRDNPLIPTLSLNRY